MSEGIVKKKRGRPVGENSKNRHLHVRLDRHEDERLNYICKMTGLSRSEVFKEAFKSYENLKRFQLGSGGERKK